MFVYGHLKSVNVVEVVGVLRAWDQYAMYLVDEGDELEISFEAMKQDLVTKLQQHATLWLGQHVSFTYYPSGLFFAQLTGLRDNRVVFDSMGKKRSIFSLQQVARLLHENTENVNL